MSLNEDYAAIVDMLRERGHDEPEIQKILHRVRQHEDEMKLDSVMDSIGAGKFDLDGLIRDALGKQ